MKGLQRLEYRGYDSAGVAFDGDCNINVKGEKVNKTRYVYTYIILSFQVICLNGGGKHLVKRHSTLVHVRIRINAAAIGRLKHPRKRCV